MKANTKTLTPLRSIRLKCVQDCCAGKPSLVRACKNSDCPLHFFRSGHNPKRKGICRFKASQDSLSLMKTINSTTSSEDKAKDKINYSHSAKPFITDEMAEKMIKAANIIIDTTNTLKPSAI